MFDGTRLPQALKHEAALGYATAASLEFGVASPTTYQFDSRTANAWLGIEKKKRKSLAKTRHPTDAAGGVSGSGPQNASTTQADMPDDGKSRNVS